MGRTALLKFLSVITLSCLVVSNPALAESPNEPERMVIFERDRHTLWVLDSLGLSAESGDRYEVHVELSSKEQSQLQSYGLRLIRTEPLPPRPQIKTKNANGYNTPETVIDTLNTVAATFPEITKTVTLGYSVEGRPIVALVLSDNVHSREIDEPSMRVLGAHHGDEWSSMEVSLALAERLASDYGTRDDVQALLNNYEIWVVPVVNPDGTAEYSRRNANSVDLNRNYGFTWTPGLGKGTYPFSEPETAAMRMMAYRRAYHHSMSMHSGATNLGWVWNHTLERSPDEAFLEDVSSRYQDINSTRDFWITNGADWYMVTGDTNDWSYGARGGQDYTLELTSRKAPAANSIETYVEEHLEAMVQFLATDGQRGRKGRVVNSLGTGVEASLTLLNSDGEPQTGYTLSDATTGAFQRLGFNDSYTLLIEAPGYTTLTLPIELSAELAPEPVEVVLNSVETFEMDIQQPLIFGHTDHTPCVAISPTLPEGYDLAIYRAGNDEPLHVLGRTDEEDCSALTLSYRAIPLWEDQGTWHLLVLNADQEPVYRFEESVTLLSTSLDPVPELLSGTFEEGVLSVSLEIDTLSHTEVEVLAITPSGKRILLSATPDDPLFQSSNLETLETGTWQLRISLVGQTWASRFLVNDGVITPLPTLRADGISTSDPSDESDQADPSDPTDSSDASDPSVSESDPSETSTTATPSEPGTPEPSDDSSSANGSSKESSSGCQSAPSAWFWLVAGVLTRRRKIRV